MLRAALPLEAVTCRQPSKPAQCNPTHTPYPCPTTHRRIHHPPEDGEGALEDLVRLAVGRPGVVLGQAEGSHHLVVVRCHPPPVLGALQGWSHRRGGDWWAVNTAGRRLWAEGAAVWAQLAQDTRHTLAHRCAGQWPATRSSKPSTTAAWAASQPQPQRTQSSQRLYTLPLT